MLFSAVSINAQKVSVGADPGTDLTRYKTYAWATDQASPNPIISRMIISAVETQLAAKGLTKVDTDPELTVVVFGSTESDTHVSNPSWAPSLNSSRRAWPSGRKTFWSPGERWSSILKTPKRRRAFGAGKLRRRSIWPTGDRARDAKMVEKPIRNAVTKMFKQFPHPKRK